MASISAPTLLATFQTSHASSSKDRHVTLQPVHGSQGELAVLAVQGDGVWTYDLRTLRPASSYTVPPSTVFSSQPLSFVTPSPAGLEKGKGKALPQDEDAEMSSSVDTEEPVESGPRRTTLVGVQSAEKGVEGKQTGELWCWRGDHDEKTVIKSDHIIQGLHHLTSPRYSVLAVGTDGAVFLLDSTDQLVPLPHAIVTGDIISSKIVSTAGESSGVVLVGSNGRIYSFRVDHPETGVCSACLTSQSVVGRLTEKTLAADVSEDGTVTVIDTAPLMHTRSIRASTETSTSSHIPYLAVAPALTSIPAPKPLVLHAVTKPTTSLILSLLGAEQPIVLAASDLSSFSADGEISQVALLGKASATTWTAAFVVWHKHGDKDSGRSVMYTCEVTVPEKGFGMNLLLGSQERTAKYLGEVKSGKVDKASKNKKVSEAEKPEVSEIDTLLEGRIDAKSWRVVREIMRTTKTMPSATLVTILKRAIADRHIGQVYADFISLSPPAVDFRFEFRRNVSVEEATVLLAHLVKWCEAWCLHRTSGLGWPDSIPTGKTPTSLLPPLDSVIAHSSLLLDSHLPLLVEYDPAGSLLETLSASLVPLLALQAEIRQLRAPVDALLTLAKREERRRAEVKAKKDNMRTMDMQNVDGTGRGAKHYQKTGAPKPGAGARLQGQDFGKWKVEDFVF